MNARLYQKLKDLFISTVTSLTRAIDAKDRYTSGHSERVMKYSTAIGKEMKLNEEDMENLRLASLLHDVGKIGIKEDVLHKPGKLSEYEKNQIRGHPSIGVKIVESIDDSHKIIRGILEHHERFDGKGYPGRLKGRSISMEGRIIAAADTFDALTSNRPYRHKDTNKEAFFEVVRGRKTQFDPRVIKAFIKSFSKHSDIWET
jgi:putative nucleotidyltransferase with HDIG domain